MPTTALRTPDNQRSPPCLPVVSANMEIMDVDSDTVNPQITTNEPQVTQPEADAQANLELQMQVECIENKFSSAYIVSNSPELLINEIDKIINDRTSDVIDAAQEDNSDKISDVLDKADTIERSLNNNTKHQNSNVMSAAAKMKSIARINRVLASKLVSTKLTPRKKRILKTIKKLRLTLQQFMTIIRRYKARRRKRKQRVLSSKVNKLGYKRVKAQLRRRFSRKRVRKVKDVGVVGDADADENVSEEEEVVETATSAEDVRNQIKQQLQLLRLKKNIKVPAPVVELGHDEVVAPVSQTNPCLKDVLLSNEGEHLIVSVVGGYVSHDDKSDDCMELDDFDVSQERVEVETSNVRKRPGISMTDILLKRSVENVVTKTESVRAIKPSKTTDITKIKGWRSKQFDVADVSRKHTEIKNVCSSIAIPLPYYSEEPVASTSAYFPDVPLDDPVIADQDSQSERQEPDDAIVPDDIKIGETCKNSAFVSDVLDTFLNEHSTLKISYEVPKLKAEETITKPVGDMPVLQSGNVDVPVVKPLVFKKELRAKPKTLAEKRRMLKIDRENKLMQEMEANEGVYIKQLEKNEKRNRINDNKTIRENMINDSAPFSKQCWQLATKSDQTNQQFVYVNGSKIRVVGGTENKDVIIKRDATDVIKPPTKSVATNTSNTSSYKPGPLCKKPKLLKASDELYEYQICKMPRIKLVLSTEAGRPIEPLAERYLELCRDDKGFISNQWAEFAVTAVKTKQAKPKDIEFELPYANTQNKVIMKRIKRVKKVKPNVVEPIVTEAVPDINDIATIVSQMINCIENQELDKKILKEDPDFRERLRSKEDNYRPLSPTSKSDHTIIKKRNMKRSKTTLELRRLNVQVIEVDVQETKEDDAEITDCGKDHCRLGCICKCLQGVGNPMTDHCGREQCMFNCTCSLMTSQQGHHSVTLPAGTDLLSTSTMVRLQDEAKRHLAKEEKKFTQTVIKANNQTIVVGGGARDRQRRVSKLPKKYNDYVNTTDELPAMQANALEDDETPKDKKDVVVRKYPIWNKLNKFKPAIKARKPKYKTCHVVLERLQNLENVIPWCMEHNLYKCYCGGAAVEEPLPEKSETPETELSDYISYSSRYNCSRSNATKEAPVVEVTEKNCSRTRPLSNNYYHLRNKSQAFKQRYTDLRKEQDKYDTDLDYDMVNSPNEIDPIEREDSLLVVNKKRSRKQKFVNLDESQDFYANAEPPKPKKMKIAKRVKPAKPKIVPPSRATTPPIRIDPPVALKPVSILRKIVPKPTSISFGNSLINYEKSYDGLLIPTEAMIKRFIELFNFDPTLFVNIRLVEWGLLVERYKTNQLQIWFNSKKNTKSVIFTENCRRPSRFHVNIKLFRDTPVHNFMIPGIIKSLLSDTLPGDATNPKETFVIMAFNRVDWEARGSISLNSASCKLSLIARPTPDSLLRPRDIDAEVETPPTKPKEPEPVSVSPESSTSTECSMSIEIIDDKQQYVPEVVNSLSTYYKGVEITKIPVMNITNVTPEIPVNNSTTIKPAVKKLKLSIPLPLIPGLFRWYMLTLDNSFSILHITFTNSHIKYTHLATANAMASRNKKTVRIRAQSEEAVSISSFGVYAVPDQDNRVFFGPYSMNQDHGLETFRYVNGQLVNTKRYNSMRGGVEKCAIGTWFIHTNTANNALTLEEQTTDMITSADECDTEIVDPASAKKAQIEFVDLTGNDSDEETHLDKSAEETDPLMTVLKSDFSKKTNPVYETKSGLVIRHINNDQSPKKDKTTSKPEIIIKSAATKRKLLDETGPPKKKIPEPIECINLDDDSSESAPNSPREEVEEKRKKLPALYPINRGEPTESPKASNFSVIYIITNIPGVGYIDVMMCDNLYYLAINSEHNDKLACFPDMEKAISWVQILFQKYIFYMPFSLKVKFSALQNAKDVPQMPKFKNKYLNGFHMICRKGIYNLLNMTPADINKLGFNEKDTMLILSQKCELLAKKNALIFTNLGDTPESPVVNENFDQAPYKLKILELREDYLVNTKKALLEHQKKLISKINVLLSEKSESVQQAVKTNVTSILKNSNAPIIDVSNEEAVKGNAVNVNEIKSSLCAPLSVLPAGKLFKIIDGKVVIMENAEAIIPKGLSIVKNPVTTPKIVTKVNQLQYPLKLTRVAKSPGFTSTLPTEPVNFKSPPNIKLKIIKKPMVVPISGTNKTVSVIGVPQTGTSILKTTSKLVNITKN